MDKISDEDVSYLSRKKALPLKSEAKNNSGIWAIKFWFDKDGKYIGTSGTGNAKFPTLDIKNSNSSQSKPYSKAQWDKIRKSLTFGFPKTGYLIPVLKDEYNQLKNGDMVIGCLCGEDEYYDYPESKVDTLLCGKIFLDEGGQIYFIHDDYNMSGIDPDNSPEEEYPDIEWGNYAWCIANSNKIPGPDHFNLHKVIKSDTPLNYHTEKSDVEKVSSNPFEFNLSLEEIEDNKLILSDWVGNTDELKRIEKDADFAVILYVDGILSRGLKSKSTTSAEKKEAREGAVALMSDEDFKQANLEKYNQILVQKIGITPESIELKNLQNFVATIMASGVEESYSFLSLSNNEFKELNHLSYQIKRLVSSISVGNSEIIKIVYNDFINEFKRFKRQASYSYKNKKASMSMLKKRENLRPLYDIILSISKKISKGIKSKEIKSGEDLKKLYFKIDSIDSLCKDDYFALSTQLRNFIENVRYGSIETSILNTKLDEMTGEYSTKNDGDSTLNKDLKRLKEIESYVEDIFG